jgi:hypothetical protein
VQLPARLTRELADTYSACNPGFAFVPRAARVLTKPGTPAGNDGHDNCNSDLILAVNDALVSPAGRRRVPRRQRGARCGRAGAGARRGRRAAAAAAGARALVGALVHSCGAAQQAR